MNSNNVGHYYQKSSFALKIARYFVVLIFIVFLISCILIYRNDITIENIQFLAKYITLNDGSSHFYNDEFQINSTSESDVFMLRDNVAVVDKTGIALYELSGSKLFNYGFSYSAPASVSDSHNILIHDIKGTELSIFNSFSRVFTQKYPYSVRSADINENGFAVITNEKGYRSALIVYNDSFKESFKWLSETNYLSALSLAPSGNQVAVATAKSENGVYKCTVRIFDTAKNDPIYSTEEFDELVIALKYSADGKSIYALTDSGIRFYDNQLKENSYYKFNQSKIESYYIKNDRIFLTELNNLSGNSVKLTCIDNKGNVVFDVIINDSVSDIAIGENVIYALGNDCVYKYVFDTNGTCSLDSLATLSERYNSILCDSENNCYITSDSKLVKVLFDKKEAE